MHLKLPLVVRVAVVVVAATLVARSTGAVGLGQDNIIERDGKRYQLVEIPETTTEIRKREESVERLQYRTELRDTQRTHYVPVTEYRWETRWHGWWNIFRGPHLAYHYVPRTRWEARTESIRTPVTVPEIVRQTRTIQEPVAVTRMTPRQLPLDSPASPDRWARADGHVPLQSVSPRQPDAGQAGTRLPPTNATARRAATGAPTGMTSRQAEPSDRYGSLGRLDTDPPRGRYQTIPSYGRVLR